MKIRLQGTAKEICIFCDKLRKKDFVFLSSSKFYPDREQNFVPVIEQTGRMYLEIDLEE